ncbi:hypothetical protein C1645_817386 [Glomus cerebriforme]|uniref:Uncharacterized protein n=1 Tax=Glomus cerebriforme TaxID=658196 RepID=A0A397TIR8_9GLOM|nr:hypothetical protein C1645_817386 [Glomus cerebriforme]
MAIRACGKKYKKPLFGLHTITCKKDIWNASEINIHDALKLLDRSICFLDGRAFEDIAGELDFIVVDENYEVQEKKLTGSKDTTVYDPVNQIYGYICANKLCHGILSTFDQIWFLKREIKRDQGWLQNFSNENITNVTLLLGNLDKSWMNETGQTDEAEQMELKQMN